MRSGADARFDFGQNWQRFLTGLDDARVREAERSLREMLEVDDLAGRTFLDVGCGSGLFSLAAFRMGAERVRSFDADPASAECAEALRRRFAGGSDRWTIDAASVLDTSYLAGLGEWDVVYAWGVLHHTGDMSGALDNVAPLVAPGGRLFVAIYNDQGHRSVIWRRVKRLYNRLPAPLQTPFAVAVMLPRELLTAGYSTVRLQPAAYVRGWTEYKAARGMSRWHDLIDWVGGYPFEVATPEQIFMRYRRHGFTLTNLITCRGGLGCNQFVFERDAPSPG